MSRQLLLTGVCVAAVVVASWSYLASRSTASSTNNQTKCSVTVPSPSGAPPEVVSSVGSSPNLYGNQALWVVLPPNGILTFPSTAPELGTKFGWWRIDHGTVVIDGRRLDAPASPLQVVLPDGYGDTGFQASNLVFPTEGCWEVRAQVAGQELRFIVDVRKERG